jgi:DNA-binding PadR family transcriptional regulator
LAQEKILTALRELAQASAVQIGEHAKLAYSTTTANLRALEAAGLARRERHPDGTMTWQPAGTTPGAGTTPQVPQPQTPDGDDANSSRSRRKPPRRQAPTTGPTVTQERPPRTGNHAAGQARPAPGDQAPSAAGSKRSRRAGRHGAPEGAGDTPRARRAKGALRAEVLAVLQDHPDQRFKVSQVCKHLPGASAGAIANALDKLVAEGTARQVTDKPATYQAE